MVSDPDNEDRGERVDSGERRHEVFTLEGEMGNLPRRDVNLRPYCKRFFKKRERRIVEACYKDGCVISVGGTLILARPVHTSAGWDKIRDTRVVFDDFNCWYIELAHGEIEKFVQNIPFDLPYVGYEHRGRLSLIPLERFKNYGKLTKQTKSSEATPATDEGEGC